MAEAKVYHRSARDDWETPPPLFRLLDRKFSFNLDVCASQENAKCGQYFGAPDTLLFPLATDLPRCIGADGLAQSWQGHTCWMNPPYSQTRAWLAKAQAEGRRTTVVCLLAARTDTRAWFEHVWPHAAEIRFLKGRLRFEGAEAGAPFPSAVVIYSGSVARPKAWGWDWRAEARASDG